MQTMQLAQLVLACALATSSAAESTSSTSDSWYKKVRPPASLPSTPALPEPRTFP